MSGDLLTTALVAFCGGAVCGAAAMLRAAIRTGDGHLRELERQRVAEPALGAPGWRTAGRRAR